MNSQRIRTTVAALLAAVPVAAQSLPTEHPGALEKGEFVPTALSPDEWQALRAQQRPLAPDVPELIRGSPAPRLDRVVVDRQDDDRFMASGATYKAEFGPDGFTYVPFFGSDAPRNFPVRFTVRRVTIGGVSLSIAESAKATARGAAFTLDRGAVRERYDLALEQVEQTFVIDGAEPGDVVLELAVETELREDAHAPGLQFVNELGRVDYGTAYLVTRGGKTPIESEWTGESIRMRVPASMREAGPIVIDPILATVPAAFTGAQNSLQPDIAYDATTDRFLVVWQYAYSATDNDIWSELRNGDGAPIAGSIAAIDTATTNEQVPRVANINSADRFVVVYEKTDANAYQGRTMIYTRFRDANSANATGSSFLISDPTLIGNNWSPDVGGDSGNGDYWCVSWMLHVNASESYIFARTFHHNGNATANLTTFVASAVNNVFANVAVSQCNGGGATGSPRWCLVYEHMFSPTDFDVHGAVLDTGANITAAGILDFSPLSDRYPSVSSPATDLSGTPHYMVTYERQNPSPAAMARYVSASLGTWTTLNLTSAYGFGGFWVRCESDGCRFAVVNGAATISVGTIGFRNGNFFLHEAPQALSGVPAFPRICSKRSGGGPRTAYALAWVDQAPNPDVIQVTTYSGRQPGATFSRRIMGCSSLRIEAGGLAFLGHEVSFALQNTGADIVGTVLGAPAAPSTLFCAQCPVGVDLAGPTAIYGGSSLTLPIPCVAPLAGVTLSVQGFGIGSGPCVASLRFTDTIDFTMR